MLKRKAVNNFVRGSALIWRSFPGLYLHNLFSKYTVKLFIRIVYRSRDGKPNKDYFIWLFMVILWLLSVLTHGCITVVDCMYAIVGFITCLGLIYSKIYVMFPPWYGSRLKGDKTEIYSKLLKYFYKYFTHFWKVLSIGYLVYLFKNLLYRNTSFHKRQHKVGELVLNKNDKLQRGQWKIGRVDKVTPGQDGVVRRVELILPQRNRNGDFERLNRPPRLLVPFECEVDKEVQEN